MEATKISIRPRHLDPTDPDCPLLENRSPDPSLVGTPLLESSWHKEKKRGPSIVFSYSPHLYHLPSNGSMIFWLYNKKHKIIKHLIISMFGNVKPLYIAEVVKNKQLNFLENFEFIRV
jgi:hypothetical protein